MSTRGSVRKSVDELRLHVEADGRVWYGDGVSISVSDLSPEEFAGTSLVKRSHKIMFLGTHANASLIRAVYMVRREDTPSRKVMIASPRVGVRKNTDKPEVVFSRMATNSWASSVGGWRPVTSHDFVIYSLIAEIRKAKGALTKSAELYLKQHPAWPAVSFIYRHQPNPACRLLTEIIDPRWHVDVDEPDRYAQLRNYLGFGATIKIATKNISSALNLLRGYNGACPPCNDVRLYRTMLTVASWYGGFVGDPKLTGDSKKDLSKHLREPTAFLMRYLYDPREEEKRDVRFVRANHRFIRFLKMVWLDNLYLSRRYRTVPSKSGGRPLGGEPRRKMLCPKGPERTLFVPEHFFTEMDEVEAWKEHSARLLQSRK